MKYLRYRCMHNFSITPSAIFTEFSESVRKWKMLLLTLKFIFLWQSRRQQRWHKRWMRQSFKTWTYWMSDEADIQVCVWGVKTFESKLMANFECLRWSYEFGSVCILKMESACFNCKTVREKVRFVCTSNAVNKNYRHWNIKKPLRCLFKSKKRLKAITFCEYLQNKRN